VNQNGRILGFAENYSDLFVITIKPGGNTTLLAKDGADLSKYNDPASPNAEETPPAYNSPSSRVPVFGRPPPSGSPPPRSQSPSIPARGVSPGDTRFGMDSQRGSVGSFGKRDSVYSVGKPPTPPPQQQPPNFSSDEMFPALTPSKPTPASATAQELKRMSIDSRTDQTPKKISTDEAKEAPTSPNLQKETEPKAESAAKTPPPMTAPPPPPAPPGFSMTPTNRAQTSSSMSQHGSNSNFMAGPPGLASPGANNPAAAPSGYPGSPNAASPRLPPGLDTALPSAKTPPPASRPPQRPPSPKADHTPESDQSAELVPGSV
jgi:hypothetical protein